MKFALNSVSKLSGRSGVLSGFEKFPAKCLQTPLLLLYTRGASVPYLSREVLDYLTTEFQALCVPLQGTEHMEVAAKAFGQDIQTFAGLDGVGVSFVTLKDTAEVGQSSLHENNSVPFFTRHGKVQMTVERFMDVVGAFKPDFYQILGDADTNEASGKKRVASATKRTEEFFVACLEKHRKSVALQKVGVFATVTGGYSLPMREISAKFYDEYKKEISGYVIDGLHSNGPEVSMIDRKALSEVVGHTNGFLPEDKMRVMLGAFNPLVLLELVSLGVDAFDSSYVYLCSKQNRALTFSFDTTNVLSEATTLHLDMSDVKFKEEFVPIDQKCQCLACKKHTRAYIYHLIDCNELLAQILLTIHNMHHYFEFFKTVRAAITNDSLPQLIKHIEAQIPDEKAVGLDLPPVKQQPSSGGEKKKGKIRLATEAEV